MSLNRITPEQLASLKLDHEIDPLLAAHVERAPVYNERGQFSGYDVLFDVEASNTIARDYIERKQQKEQGFLAATSNIQLDEPKSFLSRVPDWLIGVALGIICAAVFLVLNRSGVVGEIPKLPVPIWLIGLVVTIVGYGLGYVIKNR